MTVDEAERKIEEAGLDPMSYIRAAFRHMERCDDPDDNDELERELDRQVEIAMEEIASIDSRSRKRQNEKQVRL